jgi:hypothetical protein
VTSTNIGAWCSLRKAGWFLDQLCFIPSIKSTIKWLQLQFTVDWPSQ